MESKNYRFSEAESYNPGKQKTTNFQSYKHIQANYKDTNDKKMVFPIY